MHQIIRSSAFSYIYIGEDLCHLPYNERKPAANDFERLHHLCPELETVGFNGQASGKFAPQFAEAVYRTVVLPSSSPAHMAMSFEQKLAVWRRLVADDDL